MQQQKTGPLAGVTVIDLTHQLAGPTCGVMLADMGAEVIKVERIGGGDDTRRMTPPEINGESAAFMMMNRNKRGIVLNLKTDSGLAALRRMLETADIVIENYRVGTLAKLGLDYDSLKGTNPGLIYGAISGFGRSGPLSGQGGFDLIAQGLSGLMTVTGEGPDRPPVKIGPPICDITAGLILTMGVLAAYSNRLKTGVGQEVDTSLLEAGVTQTFWQSAIFLATGTPPHAMGTGHPLNAPYEALRTKDGHIIIGAASVKLWPLMLQVIGAEDLAEDPRFVTNGDRMANRPALIEALEMYYTTRTTDKWMEALAEAGVPCGPILDTGEMTRHPQVLARDMIQEVEHPIAGTVKTIGHPLKYARTPASVVRAAPVYGQHTREVLREYGYSDAEIDQMAADGAAVLADLPTAEAAE